MRTVIGDQDPAATSLRIDIVINHYSRNECATMHTVQTTRPSLLQELSVPTYS